MFCVKCGKELPEDSAFCPHCGGAQSPVKSDGAEKSSGAAAEKTAKKGGLGNIKTFFIFAGMIAVFAVLLTSMLRWKADSLKQDDGDSDIDEEFSDNYDTVKVRKDPFSGKIEVGDVITFGEYEQDGNELNGAEPIEWDVIGKKNGKFLLISHYVLDNKEFDNGMADTSLKANANVQSTYVTWKSCSLRQWLNSNFYSEAFSDKEKKHIVEVTNENSDYPQYAKYNHAAFNHAYPIMSYGCENTDDKVFLLSVDEFDEYYKPYEMVWNSVTFNGQYCCPAAIVSPTDYALKHDIGWLTLKDVQNFYVYGISDDNITDLYKENYEPYINKDYLKRGTESRWCGWMLRSTQTSSDNKFYAVQINSSSTCFASYGAEIWEKRGIRPAIWVEK